MTWQTLPAPAAPFPSTPDLARTWRVASRLTAFVLLCVWQAVEWLCVVALTGRAGSWSARAAWLHRFCQRLLGILGLEVEYRGAFPQQGLLVGNHVSYLDVIALSAHRPLAFVAKRDIRSWPGLGVLISWAGTVFVNREQRCDVTRAGAEMARVLHSHTPLCIFAEGTSSSGAQVLPFRSSLLAPAIELECPVTPVHISYRLDDGDPREEVAYYGEMSFFPHLLNLLSHPRVRCRVRFGPAQAPGADRKTLAKRLHTQVTAFARHYPRA